jgi:hypothetical protein
MAGEEFYQLKLIFHDPSRGFINQRLMQHFISAAALCDKAKIDDSFVRTLSMIANKLGAVWYHWKRYEEIEARLVEEAQRRGHDPRNPIEYSPELCFECDSFLVQVKSCLDHLVKLPRAFIGKGWNLATFGGKGEDVVKAARNSVPDRLKGFAEGYVMVVEAHKEWLTDVIHARDRINHMQEGGIDPADAFAVFTRRQDDGTVSVRVPVWFREQTVAQFMAVSWERLFTLCEDIIATSIAMALPDDAAFVRQPGIGMDSDKSPWRVVERAPLEAAAKSGDPRWSVRSPPDREGRRGPGKKRQP